MKNKVLIISLQKFGGGAIDALGLSNGLNFNNSFHYLVISENNELAEKFTDTKFRKVFKIKTFKSSFLDFFVQTFVFFRFSKLLKILYQIKPDIIFMTHFHPWLIFIFILKPFLKYKLLYGVHDNPFDPKEKGPPFMILLEKFFVKNANVVITYSNFVKEDIKKYLPTKDFALIYLGVHKDLFPYYKKNIDINKEKLVLLFFGRILPYKGLDILLNSFEILRKKNLNIQLIIVGSGTIDPKIKEKIKNLNVILKNYWISNEELFEILEMSDIIIVPYKKATQSGPINIGLAYGFPIIASNIGSFPEFIKDGENGFLFEKNNYYELAEKIEYLYFNRNKLKEVSENSYRKGLTLSWENTIKDLIKILEKF